MRTIKINNANFESVKEALSRYIFNDIRNNPENFGLMNVLCQFYKKITDAKTNNGDIIIEVKQYSITAISKSIRNNISEDIRNNPDVTLEWIVEMMNIYNAAKNTENIQFTEENEKYDDKNDETSNEKDEDVGDNNGDAATAEIKYKPDTDENLDIENSDSEDVVNPAWKMSDDEDEIDIYQEVMQLGINELINEFCTVVDNNKKVRIDALLNYYIKNKNTEEQKTILENYILFIRSAEIYKDTEGMIKQKISKNIQAGK